MFFSIDYLYLYHIIGETPAIKECLELAHKVVPTTSRVLFFGESGTGKELFAQAIHNNSLVCNGPFVAISCAAIPRDLIEAELFGYVAGAFIVANSPIDSLDTAFWYLYQKSMTRYKNNISLVAKDLGISRSTLYRKIKQAKTSKICTRPLAAEASCI